MRAAKSWEERGGNSLFHWERMVPVTAMGTVTAAECFLQAGHSAEGLVPLMTALVPDEKLSYTGTELGAWASWSDPQARDFNACCSMWGP